MQLVNAATVPRAEKILRRATCPASIVVRDCVYVSGPMVGVLLQVALAAPLVVASPAVGIVTRKYDATTCLVQLDGPMPGIYSGLTPGAPYYVGADGRLNATPPAVPAQVQQMGVALDDDVFLIHRQSAVEAATPPPGADFDKILVLRWNPHDPPLHIEPSVVIEESSGHVMTIQ